MSAMLETYDLPMHDYQNDLDIQMHPSSDQWFPDETQMEEDAPGGTMKPEIYSSAKGDGSITMKTDTYTQEKTEVTIEVDMEPFSEHHAAAEYDMEADEDIHHAGGETLDVEVYDVSLAHSPLMNAGELVRDGPSNFVGSLEHPDTTTLLHKASPIVNHTSDLPSLEPQTVESPVVHDFSASSGAHMEAQNVHLDSGAEVQAEVTFSEPTTVQEHAVLSSETQLDLHCSEDSAPDNPLTTEIPHIPEVPDTVEVAPVQETEVVDDNRAPSGQDDQADTEASVGADNVSGDPHEISEGVYIDPPPPVLLSLGAEDLFDCSFFNESPDWNTSSLPDGESHQAGLVLLRHFPTLYYEPLSAVFDALREDQYVQSIFHLAECELVLDAVDLQLIISEDNIYAREVTFHDLNILHDVSGINGQLRMRLYASTPRFITRYQYLQEHVSRLSLEQPAAVPLEANNTAKAPQGAQETIHEESRSDKPAENRVEEAVFSTELANDIDEQGNHDDSYDGTDVVAHTTVSFDPETDLPPLPVDDDEDDEAAEVPLIHGGFDTAPSTLDGPAPEPEGEETHELDEPDSHAVISLEALEAPDSQDRANAEGEPGEIHGEVLVGESVGESGEEQEHAEDEYQVTEDRSDLEHGEDGCLETEYAEHDYPGDAEQEEYAGDEPVYNEQADEYYPEDSTVSQALEDQLDYVKQETAFTLDSGNLDAPQVDPEFDNTHSNADEGATTESFVAPDTGSVYEQTVNDEETDLNYGSISQPDTTEHEYDNSASKTYVGTESGSEHGPETRNLETEQAQHLEGGTEIENETFSEPNTDPTLQEAYTWEDDLDGEGDPETPLEGDNEDAPSHSNHSSVTLSSKASKRSFDDFEFEDGYENEDGHWSPPSSPDPKRTRIQ